MKKDNIFVKKNLNGQKNMRLLSITSLYSFFEAVKGVEIEDPRGKLAYLTVESTVSEESSEAAE